MHNNLTWEIYIYLSEGISDLNRVIFILQDLFLSFNDSMWYYIRYPEKNPGTGREYLLLT